MGYLSYTKYQEYGGLLSETAFSSYLYDVESKLNYLTGNRIKKLSTVPEAVLRLEYKLISLYDALNTQQSDGAGLIETRPVSSYSNGIESYSYSQGDSSNSKGSTSIDDRILTITREYLSEYPELFYRGRIQWSQR